VWPVAPRTAAEIRPALTPIGADPSEDGDGLSVVVNADAGGQSGFGAGAADRVREALPAAKVVEVAGDDLATALVDASAHARALGVAGGDGSICAAAAVAHAAGQPLLVLPSGTLNHLARDLGLDGPDDAIAALRAGHTVAVDVATIDGATFLNTASFGSYSSLVDARERLEAKVGKWPALMVALVHVLRHERPVEVELDGRRRSLWMIFVGNCRYHPHGFAPTWRERLDDGRLDVRLVDANAPWARTRLLLAVLTGRLGRSRVYEEFTARELKVRALDGPLRLARDGETFAGSEEFVIRKEERPLAVYVPPPEDSSRLSQRPNSTSSTTSTAAPATVSQGPARL
jgi:undecaprenyl-diphosphatase